MIPAEQAVRSLLALKLLGKEHQRHVMDLVFDPAIALFAGLKIALGAGGGGGRSNRVPDPGSGNASGTKRNSVPGNP